MRSVFAQISFAECSKFMTIVLAVLFFFGTATGAQAELRVVATIAPLHSLAAGVLEGVSHPVLLIRGARSPHEFTLRPSEIRQLQDADLILRVGANFESGLGRVIARIEDKTPIISMMRIVVRSEPLRGSRLRINEAGGQAGRHDGHQPHDRRGHGEGNLENFDQHAWLDIDNAIAFVDAVGKAASKLDLGNAVRIKDNAKKLIGRLRALDAELEKILAPVRKKPFITYHDAYQYFELGYGLNSVGSVTVDAHIQPGLRHLTEIREVFKSGKVHCLFTEPQFPPKLAKRLTSGTDGRVGVLDPLGAGLKPGAGQYFMLMRGLAQGFVKCLKAD